MPWPGRAGADHAALADRHAADHRHIAAEPAVRPDHDRLAILVVVIRPVSRTPHVAVLEPDRMHRRQQLVQYRGSAGMVSPRQRVEPGAQVACALSHSGELGVGGIVEFAGEHFLALAGGYGRVSPPYRHMRPVVAGAGQRQVVAQWCNGKPCPGRPARRGGERTRGAGPCTGLPSVWQDVP